MKRKNQRMEIVARRANGFLFWYGLLTAIGVFLVVLFCRDSIQGKEMFLVLGSLAIAIGGLVLCILYLRTPKIIIRYDGEYLVLREGKFKLEWIVKVNYRLNHYRSYHFSSGTLMLNISGGEIMYHDVADVEKVHDRLIELKEQKVKG